MKKLSHFIGGHAYESRNGRYTEGFNPATGEITASISLASAEDVNMAVAAAKAAFPAWSEMPALKRARVLFNFKALLDQHQDELAGLITAEHGKVFADAKGEVARGIEVVEFACAAPQLLKGQYTDQIGGGIDNWSLRQPLGVVA
ncbi:MAG TPA: aldehyde dehydrogenase family protein, partial [Bordetella sp.]|nr:aldehyde dehydrogenase family protein [Bordetella sp.]